MVELFLIRHAATLGSGYRLCGRGDPPLTDAGQAAAARLAAEVGPSLAAPIRIVSSPLLRARQTAAALGSAAPGATLDIDDRWSETDFGTAEGMTYAELALAHPEIAARLLRGELAIDWPGGESASRLAARVEAAWQDVASHRGTTLVVSHGGPLRIAIALATDRPVGEVAVPEPGSIWRVPNPQDR